MTTLMRDSVKLAPGVALVVCNWTAPEGATDCPAATPVSKRLMSSMSTEQPVKFASSRLRQEPRQPLHLIGVRGEGLPFSPVAAVRT